MSKIDRFFRRLAHFARDYTSGLDSRELKGLFQRDAPRAYSVLTRDHASDPEPQGWLPRALFRTRVLFLGLSYKLTPVRRILFAASLVLALVGVLEVRVGFGVGDLSLIGPSFLILAGLSGLVLLLALELVDRVLVRDELEVARQLQRDLLPRTSPELPGWSFVFSYRTANTIGGDYYDFLPISDGRITLVIGDASGHGIAAGLIMAIANAILKLAIAIDPSPLAVTPMLNRALLGTGDRRAFMTLFYSVLDPSNGRLEFACAGHPYPLLRHPDGRIEELGKGAVPLGLRAEIDLELMTATIEPGALLVLYTDGIPEALSSSEESFGFDRLRHCVTPGGGPHQVHDRIFEQLNGFRDGERLHDDCSLVVIERLTR